MESKINPERVTKPIQLLAAWLIGLIAVDGAFLTAARFLTGPAWVPPLLAISAVVNVPLFLGALFLLQTRFRPQMQEDIYYSRYLEITQKKEDPSAQIEALRVELSASQHKTLDVVDTMHRQLIAVVGALPEVSQRGGASAEAVSAAKSLIAASQQQLADAKQDTERQRYRIALNNLLPEYAELAEALGRGGFTVTETFGRSSSPALVPRISLITFGRGVPVELLRELLHVVGSHFAWINHSTDDVSVGRIYLGSYGYEKRPVAKLADVFDVLRSAASIDQVVTAIDRAGVQAS